jgi:hypothetical protein
MEEREGWQDALAVLGPLDSEIERALAAGDVTAAVRLAFCGAARAAALVSDGHPAEGMASMHGVYVELTRAPLSASDDGTLVENGAYVSLAYRHWDVAPEQAERIVYEWQNAGCWAVDSP